MSRLLIMIFWGFLLYFILKAVVGFLRQIAQSGGQKERNNNNGSDRTNYTSGQVNNHKYNIKKDDIVDADFVEIKPDNEKKTEK